MKEVQISQLDVYDRKMELKKDSVKLLLRFIYYYVYLRLSYT
jgi:hypothetical protein